MEVVPIFAGPGFGRVPPDLKLEEEGEGEEDEDETDLGSDRAAIP